jgi:hypothetical protein
MVLNIAFGQLVRVRQVAPTLILKDLQGQTKKPFTFDITDYSARSSHSLFRPS